MDTSALSVVTRLLCLMLVCCYSNGQSVTQIACRRQDMTIDCPEGHGIFPEKVNYGRTVEDQCGPPVSLGRPCLSTQTAFSRVQYKCLGEQSCLLKGNTHYRYGADLCPGISKYLNITHSCLPENSFILDIGNVNITQPTTPENPMVVTSPKYPQDYAGGVAQSVTFTSDLVATETGESLPVIYDVELLDINVMSHPDDTCEDYVVVSGNGCKDLLSLDDLLSDDAITVQQSPESTGECCNCHLDGSEFRNTVDVEPAMWNMSAACTNEQIHVDLTDETTDRAGIEVLAVAVESLRSIEEGHKPSGIRVTLTSPWGDETTATLTSNNNWRLDLKPDSPIIETVVLEPLDGTGSIPLVLHVYGCDPEDAERYHRTQEKYLCDNKPWSTRHKQFMFRGPELSVRFRSNNQRHGRGYMLSVTPRVPWVEIRALPTEAPIVTEQETEAPTTQEPDVSVPTSGPSDITPWTYLTQQATSTADSYESYPHQMTFSDGSSSMTVTDGGAYMIVTRVFTNTTSTLVALTVNDHTHNIAWTPDNQEHTDVVAWQGFHNNLILQLDEGDELAVVVVRGGLSVGPEEGYSVRVFAARIS